MTDESGDGQLEARLAEQESFEPSDDFVEQANVSDESIYEEFESEWPESWTRAADLLDWDTEHNQVLDDSEEPFSQRFADGTLNASYNCVARHV